MEKDIVEDAIKRFSESTGLKIRYEASQEHPSEADGFLFITGDEKEYCFQVEVKQTINKTIAGQIALQILLRQDTVLTITRYVSPQLAGHLKNLDIYFLDTAGNAYIKSQSLYIFSKGNKLSEDQRPDNLSRAFKAKGLQVLFALMRINNLENRPLREIAELSNVALGTVQWVMKDLKKLGYLIDMGKRGKRLIKKEDLLSRWTITYSEQLRPKQLIGRFTADNRNWWVDTKISQYGALWGGEVAGDILTQNLKPEIITIYTNEQPGTLILKGKLKKDLNGEVEILRTFWSGELTSIDKDTVHPILVYADLIASGDKRNIEIANMIYEKEITGLIRED
jgi:hypothetical protein